MSNEKLQMTSEFLTINFKNLAFGFMSWLFVLCVKDVVKINRLLKGVNAQG